MTQPAGGQSNPSSPAGPTTPPISPEVQAMTFAITLITAVARNRSVDSSEVVEMATAILGFIKKT